MNDVWPKDEVAVANEKTTLLAFLGHQRSFLLRKADDATALDEVFLTDEPEPDDLLPLVASEETPPGTIDEAKPDAVTDTPPASEETSAP